MFQKYLKENEESIFYIPICKKKNCNGILELEFDLQNFVVNYQCEKDINHNRKSIYFETFNKYYLEKQNIDKCTICLHNLEIKYECKQCEKLYCHTCFLKDEHIKENKNNAKIKSEHCEIHNSVNNIYCFNCLKNICDFCKENNYCKEHDIIKLSEIKPNFNQLESLKNKMKEKKNYIKELINSIDTWLMKITKKINLLKKNLKDEMLLLDKIFGNFNQHFLNYTYYSNFNKFNKFIKISNNNNLYEFYNSFNFKNQTKIMFQILFDDKKIELQRKKGFFKSLSEDKNDWCSLISKIDEENFFIYSSYYNYVWLVELNNIKNKDNDSNEKKITLYDNNLLEFNEEILSVTSSLQSKKIYCCLQHKREIRIINFDLDEKKLKLDELIIRDNNYFNKCIELDYDLVAAIDKNSISLWRIDKLNKSYFKEKKIELYFEPFDLLKIDENFIISTFFDTKEVVFYDKTNLDTNKVIKNVDIIKSHNCLFSFGEYIIINCEKGISLLLIKTKEIVQYINSYNEPYDNKLLCSSFDRNIFILYRENKLIRKMKFQEGCFIPIEEFEINIKKEDLLYDLNDINNFICMNYDDNDIIASESFIYLLKKN